MQREKRVDRKLGCFIWIHCQTDLLNNTHTDGGVNWHTRDTYQSLADDKERVKWMNGGSASDRKWERKDGGIKRWPLHQLLLPLGCVSGWYSVWLAGRRKKRSERGGGDGGRVKSESESHEWTQQVPQSDSSAHLTSLGFKLCLANELILANYWAKLRW